MSLKKIALVGNMNNNFFVLLRYLISWGYNNSHLYYLSSEPSHFSPENDTYNKDFLKKTSKINVGDITILNNEKRKKIQILLKNYDFIICSGPSMGLLHFSSIKIDLFIPYGSDLYDLPFPKFTKNVYYYIRKLHFSRHQRLAIKKIKYISIADEPQHLMIALETIGFKGELLKSGVPMMYPEKESYSSTFSDEVKQIKNNYKCVLFHQSRENWHDCKDPKANKGNNILYEGLSKFISTHPNLGKNVAIISLEYGNDVEKSKKLIKKLGIKNNVFWFPKMKRRDLLQGLKISDIIAGQFVVSYFTYGAVFEALANSKPLLHYLDKEKYKNFTPYPFLNASNPDEISDNLLMFFKDEAKMVKIGNEGGKWYSEFFISNVKKDIEKIIKKEC